MGKVGKYGWRVTRFGSRRKSLHDHEHEATKIISVKQQGLVLANLRSNT